MMAFQWAILEDNFPASVNRAVEWVQLKNHECRDQDHCAYERDGALAYADKPVTSSAFTARQFIPPEADPPTDFQCKSVWAYGRWWRISPDAEYPFRMEYTDVGQSAATEFVVYGYDDFNQDGDDPIRMIAPDGDGRWFVLKEKCGYTLLNANGSSTNFRKTAAHYGVGNSNPGQWYSNAVIAGNVVTMWTCAGTTKPRHFMWNGAVDGATELSANVRPLAEGQSENVRCEINWARNLVIAGPLVYDLEMKRCYYFSAANTASFTSRPYRQAHYVPVTVSKFAFICTGKSGQFNATMEYGQAEDDLQQVKAGTIKITDQTKNRFRHVWELPTPVTARVFRIKIDGLTGTGITQIECLSELGGSPDSPDDVK